MYENPEGGHGPSAPRCRHPWVPLPLAPEIVNAIMFDAADFRGITIEQYPVA